LTIFKRYSKLFRRFLQTKGVAMVKVREIFFLVNFWRKKLFAVDRLCTFCGRNFCRVGQKTQKLSSANTFFP